jgi:murein DD-endopeptidase MepM/ murein hydrolase activator NlpD
MKLLKRVGFPMLGIFISAMAFTYITNAIPNINPIEQSDIEKISSTFGERVHPVTHEKKMHNGIDFVAAKGTKVMATADGKVVSTIQSKTGYGNFIIIQHENNVTTLYAQLDKILVEAGREVSQKDIIGTVGSSGTSTGPHLHYEVMVNDVKVDPKPYLSKN